MPEEHHHTHEHHHYHHHLTPEEKVKREEIVHKLKHKPGIHNPYAVATAAAEEAEGVEH